MASPVRRFQLHALAVGVLTLVLVFSHFEFLDTPYFWDELGQYVPAALDIYQSGSLIPRSTLPNIHPPGLMAWLALCWHIAGYSVRATRVAMLVVGAAGLLVTFHLGKRFAEDRPVTTGVYALALLYACPLYWSQSVLAMLDMPAMVFTTLALILFLDGRVRASALACVAAVLMKETAIAVPAVLAFWLWRDRRIRDAAWFAAPAVVLVVWTAALWISTGHIFGNREFTDYNLFYPLHPVRLTTDLLRRAYYLFVANFHWLGTIALVGAWRGGAFRGRRWEIVGSVFAAEVLIVTVLGGAVLERYLLPALPLLYAAVGAAWSRMTMGKRLAYQIPMLAGMSFCLLVNPPYPFPFENNLAWTDFVALQEQSAAFVVRHCPGQTVASVWPLTDALRRPQLGFVSHPQPVFALPDFHRESVMKLRNEPVGAVVLYSRTWNPPWGLLRVEPVRQFLARYWGYEPEITANELANDLGLTRVARFDRRGQWAEVWTKQPVTPVLPGL